MKLLRAVDINNRVICCDNWFTSLPLAKDIIAKGGHLVGTICEKPYLPSMSVAAQGLYVGESLAVFNHEDKVNVVYQRVKPTKTCRIMTTKHFDFTDVEEGKTEATMFYNGAKSGVDAFDKMCADTSTARKTQRWPLCMFYATLNIIMNNSFIIWKSQRRPDGSPKKKYDFIMDIALVLAKPYAVHRYDTVRNLREEIKLSISKTFRVDQVVRQGNEPPQHVDDPEEADVELEQVQQQPEPQVEAPQQEPQQEVINNRPIVSQPRRRLNNGRGDLEPIAANIPRLPACPIGIPSGNFVFGTRQRCCFCPTVTTWSGKTLCNRCKAPVCHAHSRKLCHDCFN